MRKREVLPILFCTAVIALGVLCLLSQLNILGGELLYYPLKYKTKDLIEKAIYELNIAKSLYPEKQRLQNVEDAVERVQHLLEQRLYKQAYNGAKLVIENAVRLREETIKAANKKIKHLEALLLKERAEKRLLCKKIHTLNAQIKNLTKECAALKEQAREQQKNMTNLLAEKERLSIELISLMEREKNLLSTIEDIKAENEDLKRQIAYNDRRFDAILSLLGEKGEELKEVNALNQALKEGLQKVSQELAELRIQFNRAQEKKEEKKDIHQLLKETHLLLKEAEKIGAARFEPKRFKKIQAILKKITPLIMEGREEAAFLLAEEARKLSEDLYLSTAKRVKGFEETVLIKCIRALVFWKHEE